MHDPFQKYYQGDNIIKLRRDWCKGCDICVDACPEHILELDETGHVFVTDISKCIFCAICAERCPDFCFSIERASDHNEIINPDDETRPGK